MKNRSKFHLMIPFSKIVTASAKAAYIINCLDIYPKTSFKVYTKIKINIKIFRID